jgi:serine/threonine-protein kinase
MLTGRLPHSPAPSLSQFNTDLDASWDDFIRRVLSPDPSRRFSSARRMHAQLDVLAAEWEDRKARICRLPRAATAAAAPKTPVKRRLRRDCVKIHPQAAADRFGTDELRRPLNYVANAFVGEADAIVRDEATGLMWQQGGCAFPLNWKDAGRYLEKLNSTAFAGFNDWRIPTVDELMSLLTEVPQAEDYCIEPLFDQTQKWLWSCDRRSFTAAWYVSVDLGFVAWQDFSAYFYVRAVRTASEDD